MSAPITHGAKSLALRVFSTRPQTRIDDRTRRTLARIQRSLHAQPIEHLHALTIGRLARFELILQAYEAHCLTHPDQPAPQHMLSVANAWRRTGELLVQLEAQLADRKDKAPSLAEYLREKAATAPPVAAPPTPVAATPAAPVGVPTNGEDAKASAPADAASEGTRL